MHDGCMDCYFWFAFSSWFLSVLLGFLQKPSQIIAAIGFVAMMVSILAIEFNPLMSAEERELYLELEERIQSRQQ